MQVIIEVARLITRSQRQNGSPALTWTTFGGVTAGVAIMYLTALCGLKGRGRGEHQVSLTPSMEDYLKAIYRLQSAWRTEHYLLDCRGASDHQSVGH